MPWPQSRPLIRFVCWMRSLSSVARSRVRRRRSSSSGLGGRTIEHTRRSPRAQAMRVRRSISPSIVSVLARRCRRLTAIEAGSATWLEVPFRSSRRCSQKPSSPASWMTRTSTGRPVRRSAVVLSRAKRSRRAAPSPPATACLDSLSLPGASTVTSHRDSPSSSAAKSLPASGRVVASIGVALGSAIIGCLHPGRGNLGPTGQAVAHPHRIFFGRARGLRVRPDRGPVEERRAELDPAPLRRLEQPPPRAQLRPADEQLGRPPPGAELGRDRPPRGAVPVPPDDRLQRPAQVARSRLALRPRPLDQRLQRRPLLVREHQPPDPALPLQCVIGGNEPQALTGPTITVAFVASDANVVHWLGGRVASMTRR